MKELMELMQKKGTPVDPKQKSSKMAVVDELRKLMSQLIKEDMSSEDPAAEGEMASAVTVEAPDQESLEMGLDKAKDVVSSMPEDMIDEEEDEDLFA